MPTFYGPELVTNGEFTSYGTVDYDFVEYGVYYVDDIPGWTPISGHGTELLKGWTVGYDWGHNGTNRLQSLGDRTTGWTSFMEIESDLIDLAAYTAGITAGIQEFLFSGWYSVIGDDASHPDQLRIKFYYLDVDENILSTFDTGVYATYGGGWHEATEQRVPPSGTRYAKVYIWSNQVYGFSPSNVFDSFSLRAVYDSNVFDSPATQGLQVHPYNLVRSPDTDLSATTAAGGYTVETLRDTRTSRKLRSTTTILIINGDSTLVDPGHRHAHCIIFPPGHNLLPTHTIRVETHNGGAAVFDQTYTVPENPDTDPDIWGEAGITLSTYGTLAFFFGEDALASATQWRVTITTSAPNTYVEIPPFYFGWSISFDRNFFYEWGDGVAALPIAAEDQARHIVSLTFGAATDSDARKAALINRELAIGSPFYISLEPQATSTATTKDGIRQHRLTFYCYLAQSIQVERLFINLNRFEIKITQIL